VAAEATRRGSPWTRCWPKCSPSGLAAEGPLEAFIGSGSSGRAEPFDVHAARAGLATHKLAKAPEAPVALLADTGVLVVGR